MPVLMFIMVILWPILRNTVAIIIFNYFVVKYCKLYQNKEKRKIKIAQYEAINMRIEY